MTLSNIIKDFLSASYVPRQVICGFSGGADSVALLLAMQDAGLKVQAVHCHHGLRGAEADADAEWCRQFCQQRKIKFTLVHLDVPGQRRPRESVEAAGRRLRLQCWRELGKGMMPVFLGHHADDALEDFFLKLARGANTTGLTGMRAERNIDGVRLCRPLLAVRRQQIEDFLAERGINDWRQDVTNADNSFRRNAVRNQLLPLFREIFQTDAGLQMSMRNLRQDADVLEKIAGRKNPGTFSEWRSMSPAVRARVLRDALPSEQSLSHRTLMALDQTLAKARPRDLPLTITLNRRLALRLDKRYCGLFPIEPTFSASSMEPLLWNWREQPELPLPSLDGVLEATVIPRSEVDMLKSPRGSTKWPETEMFAANSMPSCLQVRTWLPGDRMVCFGSKTAKKLQDIFVNARVPRQSRHTVPFILADEQIIWAAGVRRAAFAEVQDNTRKVVVLSWLKNRKR